VEIVYNFCPTCAGTLERRQLKPGEPERPVCTRCGQIVYLDPKVAVGTIARTSDDGIVLVRRAIEPGYGLWVFPGGYVDRGEAVTTAAIREAREEAGLDVELDGLVNIYSYAKRSLIVIVYAARVVGGQLCTDDECLEARIFAADELPWEHLAFHSTTQALRDFLASIGGPARRYGSDPGLTNSKPGPG
jgi:ADP-ribose pyrophosphatase YjhB (NUDIX family)